MSDFGGAARYITGTNGAARLDMGLNGVEGLVTCWTTTTSGGDGRNDMGRGVRRGVFHSLHRLSRTAEGFSTNPARIAWASVLLGALRLHRSTGAMLSCVEYLVIIEILCRASYRLFTPYILTGRTKRIRVCTQMSLDSVSSCWNLSAVAPW